METLSPIKKFFQFLCVSRGEYYSLHCCSGILKYSNNPEVKKNFASHLYRRLISFGLKVFLNQSELERGGFIEIQIDSAIKAASIQVAIFSLGYADSKWCLNELVSMLEMLKTGETVILVFHQVEPTKLWWTMGTEALQKLEEKKMDGPEGQKPRYDLATIEK